MKKKTIFYLTLTILVTAFAIAGCSPDTDLPNEPADGPLQLIWQDAPEDTVAILINQPTAEQLNDFAPSERLLLEQSEEGFLMIPASNVEEIIIWQMEFNGTDFVRTDAVYENHDPDDEYVLDLVVMRPEGGPHYQIAFISDKGETIYYIAYDGKDGNPNIEYVKAQ
ncbi:MAG: hypothetical protein GXX92_10310 [Clostridiales bacterium]|nr:hypothetical protein [Clostridiales bacterium]